MMENESQPTPRAPAEPFGVTLDTPTRLKLARAILDKTCIETGAGYLLIMFVPGSDLVLRSYKGLDTAAECQAAVNEVVALLRPVAQRMAAQQQSNAPKPLHNDAN